MSRRLLGILILITLFGVTALPLSARETDSRGHGCFAKSPGDGGYAGYDALSPELAQLAEDDFSGMQGRRPGRGQMASAGKREGQRRKHLEQLRLLKLLEMLDLGDDQEVPFLTAYRSLRCDLGELNTARQQTLTALSGALEASEPDSGVIDSLIHEMREIKQSQYRQTEMFMEKVTDLLTPAQMGRLIIFQERFEMELLEQVREFRRQGRRSGAWSPSGDE